MSQWLDGVRESRRLAVGIEKQLKTKANQPETSLDSPPARSLSERLIRSLLLGLLLRASIRDLS